MVIIVVLLSTHTFEGAAFFLYSKNSEYNQAANNGTKPSKKETCNWKNITNMNKQINQSKINAMSINAILLQQCRRKVRKRTLVAYKNQLMTSYISKKKTTKSKNYEVLNFAN